MKMVLTFSVVVFLLSSVVFAAYGGGDAPAITNEAPSSSSSNTNNNGGGGGGSSSSGVSSTENSVAIISESEVVSSTTTETKEDEVGIVEKTEESKKPSTPVGQAIEYADAPEGDPANIAWWLLGAGVLVAIGVYWFARSGPVHEDVPRRKKSKKR